jgi:formylmethanofuran dehydrogenase subunit A
MPAVDSVGFDFSNAKTATPKSKTVRYVQIRGDLAVNVNTLHGSELAHPGDYVVQVDTKEVSEVIPPRNEGGKKIPGQTRKHQEPVFEVMTAQDFEAIYKA